MNGVGILLMIRQRFSVRKPFKKRSRSGSLTRSSLPSCDIMPKHKKVLANDLNCNRLLLGREDNDT